MLLLTAATVFRYGEIQDFKKRSSEHLFLIEAKDIVSVEKALRNATFQDVEMRRISDDRYSIVLKCPPDNVGHMMNLIQRLGGKRFDN